MIIAIIYIFFILRDIWSKVENYFLKIVRPPPWKIHSPLKICKAPSFLRTLKIFQEHLQKGGTLCKNTACTKDTALNGSEITDIYEVIIFLCFHFWIKHINNYSRLSYILNVLFYVLKFSQFSFCKCSTNLYYDIFDLPKTIQNWEKVLPYCNHAVLNSETRKRVF